MTLMNYRPVYDPGFKPAILELESFFSRVKQAPNKKVTLVVERNNGYNYVYSLDVFRDEVAHKEENYRVVERIVKTILWIAGGYKIIISGSEVIHQQLKEEYSATGIRAFDADFMSNIYENPFEVVLVEEKDLPSLHEEHIVINDDLKGCRIGFDAGGSDRKVSAVVDGEVIFSTETVWNPKITADPNYHYQNILESMKMAASKMPRVDAIGISSAGIYIDNKVRAASLFLKVSPEDFDKKVKNMYIDIAKEFGDVPVKVANDGDVTALAGAASLNDGRLLGIAMGTSEAAGYVDKERNLKGWLNELAFAPCDFNKDAMQDEWSFDFGCGVKYFSQDSVIKLAEAAGIVFEETLTPAQKLKIIQKRNEENDDIANQIFTDIGVYLGYTLAYYAHFYDMKHVMLLGRVVSGKGGNTILEVAQKVLHEEFPQHHDIIIEMPDEYTRRVGQSIAAASLPELK